MALQKEYESPISQLAEICKTVSKMPGVVKITVYDGATKVHMSYSKLADMVNDFTFEPHSSVDFPMKASAEIEGVTFFALVPQEEWEEFCTANHHCKVCGAEQEEKPVENQLTGERVQAWFCPEHCTDWIPVSAQAK